MPIDENVLNSKVGNLTALESRTERILQRAIKTKILLQKIMMVGEEYPIDEGTGTSMIESRRQSIYDACMIQADDLLAEDE